MTKAKTTPARKKPAPRAPAKESARASEAADSSLFRRTLRWIGRGALGILAVLVALILLFAFVNPPTTLTMIAAGDLSGGVRREWVDLEDMAPSLPLSVVAAEDANFCEHWGFDMTAIRAALDDGAKRGASTITQQVAKNVFLWQGRSWPRKALEAVMTPLIELVWTKRRILEVYLNVAETGRGVFGMEAAAQHYYGVAARDLTPAQAARLAAILPDPKDRDPRKLPPWLRNRAVLIADGAQTIAADGRAACFQD